MDGAAIWIDGSWNAKDSAGKRPMAGGAMQSGSWSLFGKKAGVFARGLCAALAMMGLTTTSVYGQVGRGDRYSGAAWATRSPVLAQHGTVAREKPPASEAADEILKIGG